jgi:hypothetical protein
MKTTSWFVCMVVHYTVQYAIICHLVKIMYFLLFFKAVVVTTRVFYGTSVKVKSLLGD